MYLWLFFVDGDDGGTVVVPPPPTSGGGGGKPPKHPKPLRFGMSRRHRLPQQYQLLSQSLPLGSRWTLDATLDASSTIAGDIPTGAVINAFQPVATELVEIPGGEKAPVKGADPDFRVRFR